MYSEQSRGASVPVAHGAVRFTRQAKAGIALAIVLAVGFAGLRFWLAYHDMQTDAAAQTVSSKKLATLAAAVPTIQSRPDNTLTLTKLATKKTVAAQIKSQNTVAKMHQQVNRLDGLSYLVTGVQHGYVTASGIQPQPGMEFIRVNVRVGNRQAERSLQVSQTSFQLSNPTAIAQDSRFMTTADVPDILTEHTLEPGQQASGTVIFEVTKGQSPLYLLSNTTAYQVTGSNPGQVGLKTSVLLQ